jgi:hypothetical protein
MTNNNHASEGGVSRDSSEVGATAQPTDPAIDLVDECGRPLGAVLRNEIQDAQQVFMGRGEVAHRKLSSTSLVMSCL